MKGEEQRKMMMKPRRKKEFLVRGKGAREKNVMGMMSACVWS